MEIASLLAAALLAALAGRPFARALGFTGAAARAAAAFAFGALALPPLLLAAGLAGAPLKAPGLLALAAAAAAAAHLALRRGPAPAPLARASSSPSTMAAAALAAGALALALGKLARTPLWAWDHYAIWGVKARRMVSEGRLDLGFLSDPAFEIARGDHPLGVPMLWRYLALGGLPSTALVRFAHAALLVALGALVAAAVARASASRRAGAAAAALVWLSPLGWDSGLAGLADLPLALGLALAGAALAAPPAPGRAAAAALAIGALPWLKQEGWPLALLLGAAALVEPGAPAERRALRRALAAVALPLAAGAALVHLFLLPRGRPYLDGDWRARAVERVAELPALARQALGLLLDPGLLGLWLLLGAALWMALARRDRAALPLLAVVHGQLLLVLAVIYLGFAGPRDQLNAALPRIAAALVPLGLIGAARFSGAARPRAPREPRSPAPADPDRGPCPGRR